MNGKSWRSSFDVELDDGIVFIRIRIRLIPGPGVSRPQLERLQHNWEHAVEALWSNKLALLLGDNDRYPVVLDLQFDQTNPNHIVVVKEEPKARIDQLNWSIWSSPAVVAHEVGHMLGAYDEYDGGALSPARPTVDGNSIMSGIPQPRVQARHMHTVRDWIRERLNHAELVCADMAREVDRVRGGHEAG